MRGLTLQQPWAALVASGAKRWETRSLRTSYRGLVAIHSSAAFPGWCQELTRVEPFRSLVAARWLRRGEILCVAMLADCKRCEAETREQMGYPENEIGDFSVGRFAYRLDDVHTLAQPIPYKGALGFWHIEPALVVRILAQAGL